MKKRWICMLAVIGMLFGMTACGSAKKADFDEESYMKGIVQEVTEGLCELASSSDYLNMVASTDSLIQIIDGWKDARIDTTGKILVISATQEDMMDYLAVMSQGEADFSGMSESVKEYVFGRFCSTISNMLNSQAGVENLAAAAVSMYTRTYVPAGRIDDQIWMIPTDQNVWFCVSFANTGDGAVTVNASYVAADQDMRETIERYFGSGVLKLEELAF